MLQAEVRLLTGDVTNSVHSGGGKIMHIAAGGDLVLFLSGPGGGGADAALPFEGFYTRTLSTGRVKFIGSVTGNSGDINQAGISGDGRYLCWDTVSPRHVFWRDLDTGETRWITKDHNALNEPFEVKSAFPVISGNGRYVAFASNSLSLETDRSKWPYPDNPAVHLYDSVLKTFRIVSLRQNGTQLASIGNLQDKRISNYGMFDMSSDARHVVYATDDPAAHGERQGVMIMGYKAVLRREISSGNTVMLNKNSSGTAVNGDFDYPKISADGSHVAFRGRFTGIRYQNSFLPKMDESLPSNNDCDLYVKEIKSNRVWTPTRTNNGAAHQGNLGSNHALSANGRVLAFSSTASNLIQGDDAPASSGNSDDIFRADLNGNGPPSLSLITAVSGGKTNIGFSEGPFIAGSGGYIAFGTNQYGAFGFKGSSQGPNGVGTGNFPAPETTFNEYEDWAKALPENERGPYDNPAKDGVSNLLKFFVGSDPTRPDTRFLPAYDFEPGNLLGFPADKSIYMTLTIRVRKVLPFGYQWAVESGDTLERLLTTPGPTLQIGLPIADGEFEIYTFRSFTPRRETGYMRLKVVGK